MGLIRDSQGNYKCKGDITEQDILSTAETLLRVLDCQKLFIGTLDGASVHCREVIRAALDINAGAAILAHNHPSGVAEPSAADRAACGGTFRGARARILRGPAVRSRPSPAHIGGCAQ